MNFLKIANQSKELFRLLNSVKGEHRNEQNLKMLITCNKEQFLLY